MSDITPGDPGDDLLPPSGPDDTSALSAIDTPAPDASTSTGTARGAVHPDPGTRLSPPEIRLRSMLAPTAAALVVLTGPQTGARFLLDSDHVTVGRDSAVEILLDHVTVSRKHASFHRHGTSFTVRDLGSLNGTRLNGRLVEETELHDGDVLEIGTYRLRFLRREEPAAS